MGGFKLRKKIKEFIESINSINTITENTSTENVQLDKYKQLYADEVSKLKQYGVIVDK